MKSLNKINEACAGVTRIMISLFLKQWIENEENLLLQKKKLVYLERGPCVGCK